MAARQREKGWSEERISKAVHELKQRQQQQEDSFSWAGKHFFECGGLDNNVVRFFRNLTQVRTINPCFVCVAYAWYSQAWVSVGSSMLTSTRLSASTTVTL